VNKTGNFFQPQIDTDETQIKKRTLLRRRGYEGQEAGKWKHSKFDVQINAQHASALPNILFYHDG
jgi:hypothetical protein